MQTINDAEKITNLYMQTHDCSDLSVEEFINKYEEIYEKVKTYLQKSPTRKEMKIG